MPYQPVSRPSSTQSLAPDRAAANRSGTRTLGGSPERAKVVARAFMRGVEAPSDQSPAWGPQSRSFSEQRQVNPKAFAVWGEQLASTEVGYQFSAPPPEPMQPVAGTNSKPQEDKS